MTDEPAVVDGTADEIPADEATVQSTALAIPPEGAAGAIIRAEDPRDILAKAKEIASPLAELIETAGLSVALDRRNPDRKHVEVGGWQAAGTMLGALGGQPVHAETVWTRIVRDPGTGAPIRRQYTVKTYYPKSQGGGLRTEAQVEGYDWEACVEIKAPTGMVVGRAEAMCSRAESTWRDRDDYALRSMAETRAESRAYRRAIGWIVHLAGFNPTPAEELGHTPGAAPLYGPEATEPQAEQVRRAIAFLLSCDPDDDRVAGVMEKLTVDGEGYLPRVASRAVAHAAAAVKAAAEAATGEAPAAAPEPEQAGEPADADVVDEHAAWAATATDEAIARVAGAGDGADPARVAAAQAEVERRVAAASEAASSTPTQAQPGTVPAPDVDRANPARAIGALKAAGCICPDPLALRGETPSLHDLCPLVGHGAPLTTGGEEAAPSA